MGLTLARTLIELHGGTTIVQSEGPVRRSEFVVRLPVGVPAGPEGRHGSRRVAVQARHILLVEDDDNVRAALQRILALYGQEQDRRRSREAGFDAHLLKPVSSEHLARLLGRVGPSDV